MNIHKTFWQTGKNIKCAANKSRRRKIKGIADHRKKAIQLLWSAGLT